MTPRPVPPADTDRAAASAAAVAARRARAAVKSAVVSGERSVLDVVETGWREPGSPEASLRVFDLLRTLGYVGPVRAASMLDELGISVRKRVGGLGARQRPRLREALRERTRIGHGRLFVLAGPTAVGKGTVAAFIREQHPEVLLSISATTRPPRPGEIDGVHYEFVSDAEFDRLIATDGLLEWATVHNSSRYGTPRAAVERALAQGSNVLLEIDLQGARSVRAAMPEATLIFLEPPSWEELVRRLVGRGTETPEQQAQRLATARVELAAVDEFDHRVVNDSVDRAAADVVDLLVGRGNAPHKRDAKERDHG